MRFKFERIMFIVAAATLVLTGFAGKADAQFESMMRYVPSNANAIIAIDIDLLEKTEMAIEEKWREQRQRVRQDMGQESPPPQRILLAAEVHPMRLDSEWELTLIDTEHTLNAEELADKLNSNVDNIGGFAAVETRGEAYVVRLEEKLAGLLHPADRQKVARWLRTGKTADQSTYLKDALKRITDRTPIVFAIELRDVATPSQVKVQIADHETFEKRQKDVDGVAELFSGIQGMSMDVQIAQNAAATLRMDFDQPAGILKEHQQLVIDLLADMGISVPEFDDWNASISGNSWLLQGKLSRQTIDRLFAMADARFEAKIEGDPSTYAGGGQPQESEGDKAAKLALNYYRDIEDIVARVGDYKGANANMYARWFRERAEELENMPTLGVDRELVDFALMVANGLRETAATLRGTSSRKVLRQTSVNLSRGGSYGEFYGTTRWGGYGYYRGGGLYNPNAEAAGRATRGTQKRMIGIQERSKAASATFQTLDDIAEEMAKLRIKMTEKYEMQF